jgi:hypothetical protein
MIAAIEMPVQSAAPIHLAAMQAVAHIEPDAHADLRELGGRLKVGDVIFIRSDFLPFRKVADTTLSWTNHVGIVVDMKNGEPVVAESRVPLSGKTSWRRFVRRSAQGRVAVARLKEDAPGLARESLLHAAQKRYGILYDSGFNLHSRRQFCSRFVREVVEEAAGVRLGEVENFTHLLARNPQADQRFWRVWYFGSIPWQRETVTPASLLNDEQLQVVFDGYAN